MDTTITKPIGFFAGGSERHRGRTVSWISRNSSVTRTSAALAAPPIECGNGEAVSAIVGTPLLAFLTTVINVDQPRKVVVRGQTLHRAGHRDLELRTSPRPPYIAAGSPWNWAAGRPSTTASYYAFPDLEDFEDILGEWLPLTPTLLSMSAMSLPTGGSFFTQMGVLHGRPGRSTRSRPPGCSSIPVPKPRSSARTWRRA